MYNGIGNYSRNEFRRYSLDGIRGSLLGRNPLCS